MPTLPDSVSQASGGRRTPPDDRINVGLSLFSEGREQFTGTGRYVSELLREFGRSPAAVRVDVLGRDSLAASVEVSEGKRPRAERGRPAGRTRAGHVLALAAAAPFLTRRLPGDLMVLHYPLTLRIPPAHAIATVQTLYDVQHHDMPENFSRSQRVWRRLTYDRGARRSTLVITISEHSRRRAIECAGVDPDRLVAIHLAVDHERFNAGGDDDERCVNGLGLPDRYLFYPASLWPHKNHRRLLEALAQVADDELQLVLAGATFDHLPALWADAERLGIEERVLHLGQIAEHALPAVYRRATALVFPSLHEGFGLPPLEAMACGCPVASSLEASLGEVCGDAVVRLDPRDPAQMAGAIEAVANDEALRVRLREEGLTRAARFTWAQTAAGHLWAYGRALELHGG